MIASPLSHGDSAGKPGAPILDRMRVPMAPGTMTWGEWRRNRVSTRLQATNITFLETLAEIRRALNTRVGFLIILPCQSCQPATADTGAEFLTAFVDLIGQIVGSADNQGTTRVAKHKSDQQNRWIPVHSLHAQEPPIKIP